MAVSNPNPNGLFSFFMAPPPAQTFFTQSNETPPYSPPFPCQPFDNSGVHQFSAASEHTFVFVGPSIKERKQLGLGCDPSTWSPVFGFPHNPALEYLWFRGTPRQNQKMRDFCRETLINRDKMWNMLCPTRKRMKQDLLLFHVGMFNTPEEPFVILGPITDTNQDIITSMVKLVPKSWRLEYTTNDVESILLNTST